MRYKELFFATIFTFFFSAIYSSLAQTNVDSTAFLKYKNYIIPIVPCWETLNCNFPDQNLSEKSKIIISTDLGGQDKDDIQSLTHFFVISDEFEVLGLISSPPSGNGTADLTGDGKGRVDDILKMIDLYNRDFSEISNARNGYPTPSYLKSISKQGQREEPSNGQIDITNEMDGANLIIESAKSDATRPLWVLVWGAASDVAKAIKKEPGIAPLLRVIFIGPAFNVNGDNAAANEIINMARNGNLWLIDTKEGSRGIYAHKSDNERKQFIAQFIKPYGCLGREFPTDTNLPGYKLGDTPSLLFVLPESVTNGNRNNPADSNNWIHFTKMNGKYYWQGATSGPLTTNMSSSDVENFLNHWKGKMNNAGSGCD